LPDGRVLKALVPRRKESPPARATNGWRRGVTYLRNQAGQDARRRVASPFVLIPRAKDDSAVRCYQKFGLVPILGQTHRLFLPLNTIAKSCA
jgi:hypothetical protein